MPANSNQRNQEIAELAVAAVTQNPKTRKQLSGLVDDIINHQRYVMQFGTPAEKAALVKAVLPQMLSAMNTVAQTEAEAEERAAYDRMRAALRGEVPTTSLASQLKVAAGA